MTLGGNSTSFVHLCGEFSRLYWVHVFVIKIQGPARGQKEGGPISRSQTRAKRDTRSPENFNRRQSDRELPESVERNRKKRQRGTNKKSSLTLQAGAKPTTRKHHSKPQRCSPGVLSQLIY